LPTACYHDYLGTLQIQLNYLLLEDTRPTRRGTP
jgi:hypothetical protein